MNPFEDVNSFTNWRENTESMIQYQLINRGISDIRVLDVFRKVPRHLFVPEENIKDAYNDYPLPIGENQTISQPYIVALMIESLGLRGDEKVLEIGTGSGYQTVLLAELVREVISIERIPSLAENAKLKIKNLGYINIEIIVGDGTRGYIKKAPYDAIIVSAAPYTLPLELVSQLKNKGVLVIPIGERYSQTLYKINKDENQYTKHALCSCVFVPLVK